MSGSDTTNPSSRRDKPVVDDVEALVEELWPTCTNCKGTGDSSNPYRVCAVCSGRGWLNADDSDRENIIRRHLVSREEVEREAFEKAAKLLDDLHAEWAQRSYPPPEWVKTMADRIRSLAQPDDGEGEA